MNRIPRTRRPAAAVRRQRPLPPPGPREPWAGTGAGLPAVAGPLLFRRIVPIPFAAWVATLDTWQLAAHDGELRLGPSVVRGPADYDPRFGTCQLQVRLARGPLRPPVRMRLHLDRWSAAATAVELIPCQRVRPSAAYFRAGHALLDALACAAAAHPPVPRRVGLTPRQPPADHPAPGKAMPSGPAAGPSAIPARQEVS